MSHSTKVQLPYLKKHLTAPKISRFKLHDEFAGRGWNTCSSPFQIKSGEGECDIIASPTKYPYFVKSSAHENYSKKKPMLLEISNIESVFLQNKQKSLKLNDDRKLSETFYDFAPKLTKQEKLNIIRHRKRAQNFHESSQNKKHCNELSKNSNANYIFSNNSLIKENSPKKGSLSVGNRNKNASNSLVHIESNDPCNIGSINLTKRKFNKHDSILEVPNVSLPILHLKNNQNEVSRTELNKNNKNLNSDSCSENLNSFFHSKDSHLKPHTTTNLISDYSSFEKSHCNEKGNLSESKIFPSILKNDSINEVSTSTISDSPVCIQDDSSSESLASSIGPRSPLLFQSYNGNENEKLVNNSVTVTMTSDSPVSIQDKSSPESAVSPIVPCSPVHSQQQGVDKNKKNISVHKKNQVHCELLRLQDLQESFDIKRHEKSLMSADPLINSISDCSPIKEKSNKQDASLNITNKFKILSEAFISNNRADVSNDHKHDSIQNDFSPVNVEPRKVLPIPKVIPSFRDENCLNEVSEAKNISVDNKIFMKTIQSSFQEKSCTGDKGSNWVQTLNWDQFSQSKGAEYENNDQIGKKSLKSIIHGGFAEQMVKLQRRERSDRVIWDHKMNELKKKAAANLITFTLASVLHFGQIIITKSTTTDINNEYFKEFFCKEDFQSNNGTIADDNASHDTLSQSQIFIVLFKREMFTKMHLKLSNQFSLYPPWHILSVPSLPFPVILCTHFAEAVVKDVGSVQKEPPKELSAFQSFPVLYKSLQQKSCECDDPVLSNDYLSNSSDLYNKSVCVSARVQRVWKTAVTNNGLQTVLKLYDNSFFLLLQTEDDIFLKLNINSNQLSDAYLEFLLNAEGKCYRFCDLIISYRYNLKKSHHLKSFLQHIQNHPIRNKDLSIQQLYCYQLIPVSLRKIPNDIHGENFPLYAVYDVQPLSFLQKNNLRDIRFSCIGKIIFQDKKDFYITDESLLCSKGKKYYLIKFENILKSLLEKFLVGSTVLLKEAVSYEDYLFVDKFSSYEILSNSQTNRLRLAYESRMKKIGLITYEHILSPLSLLSKVKDLVLFKGIISQVDENTAISWLECSLCSGENLLEDSNSVIYCEDCACIVPKPVLKVKMEVVVQDTCLSPAKVKIQLLSSTIKKILKISEDNYQPECNISDVLKKNTGVLCCYLKAIEMTDKQKVFHLREINCC